MAALESHERRHGLDERTEATSWRRREDLRRRERELLKSGGCWLTFLGCDFQTKPDAEGWVAVGNSGSWVIHIKPRRGFGHEVRCSAEDCLRHLDAVLTQQPVQEVTLTTEPIVNWSEIRALHETRSCWLSGRETIPVPFLTDPFAAQTRILRHLLGSYWPSVKEWRLPREEGARAVTKPSQALIADLAYGRE